MEWMQLRKKEWTGKTSTRYENLRAGIGPVGEDAVAKRREGEEDGEDGDVCWRWMGCAGKEGETQVLMETLQSLFPGYYCCTSLGDCGWSWCVLAGSQKKQWGETGRLEGPPG